MFAYTDMSEATNTRVTAILRETYDGIILLVTLRRLISPRSSDGPQAIPIQ